MVDATVTFQMWKLKKKVNNSEANLQGCLGLWLAFIEGVQGRLGEGQVACGSGMVTEFLSSCL